MGMHGDLLDAALPDTEDKRKTLLELVKERAKACWQTKNLPDANLLYGKAIDLACHKIEGKRLEEGRHLLYDLKADPEEELNWFGAPKFDYYNQYQHFPNPVPFCRDLGKRLKAEAQTIEDDFGVELADRFLDELGPADRTR